MVSWLYLRTAALLQGLSGIPEEAPPTLRKLYGFLATAYEVVCVSDIDAISPAAKAFRQDSCGSIPAAPIAFKKFPTYVGLELCSPVEVRAGAVFSTQAAIGQSFSGQECVVRYSIVNHECETYLPGLFKLESIWA